jgi:molybdate transport system substrate-binding protein
MRPAAAALAVLAVATASLVVLAAGAASPPRLTVYAAASLTNVLPRIDPGERYSFGGSNTLAAQIRLGAPADVFASANTTLPNGLAAKGLCSTPVVFTRNALVIVVPESNPAHIRSIYDLAKPRVKVDVAAAGVPVGHHTLQILKSLHLSQRVLANVVSRETDVRGVLAKVALGEADAGFVYATDAKTVPGRVHVVAVPSRAQPNVRYGICVVSSSSSKPAARALVAMVLGKAGQAKLVRAGFLPRVQPKPPKKRQRP